MVNGKNRQIWIVAGQFFVSELAITPAVNVTEDEKASALREGRVRKAE